MERPLESQAVDRRIFFCSDNLCCGHYRNADNLLFWHYGNNGYDVAYARTVAVNMLIFGEMFYLFNCRKLNQTIFSADFFSNKIAFIVSGILLLIQIGYTYLPFMQRWFESTPLGAVDWLYLFAGGTVVLVIVEIEKLLTGRVCSERIKRRSSRGACELQLSLEPKF